MNPASLHNLQSKVAALDDILECPVCYDRLLGKIPQCTQGHHVCRKCLTQIHQCPLCNSKFNGTRNYLAESILAKFEDIKSALTNLNSNNNVLQAAAQAGANIPKQPFAEIFPCGIDYCKKKLSYNAMIAHVKNEHEDDFVDVGILKSSKFTDWYNVEHNPGTLWEKIFYIHNMGIFFLKVYISNKGNVYGCVQNVIGSDNNQMFYYEVDMGDSDYDSAIFDGPVASTNIPETKGKYLCIGDAVYEDDDGDDFFDCNVTITRLR